MEKFESYYHYLHKSDYKFKGHSHSMWEVNILISGKMEIIYDDKIITLEKDAIILYEPNVFHRNRVVSPEGADCIIYHFYSDNIPVSGRVRLYRKDDYINHLVSLLKYECENDGYDGHRNLSANENSSVLLSLFLQKLNTEEINYVKSVGKNSKIFESAVVYMNKNIHRSVTISEIAEYCSVSQTKLKTVFSEITDKGVMEYFAILKLNMAKRYLKSGKSVREVSDIMGFSSQAYFSLWFKKLYGKAPIKYI